MKRNKTLMPNPSDVDSKWQVIDATGQTLGRMATRISRSLQGKDKPTYTPHILTGDHVVVINASKVKVTGRKLTQKIYYRHSGYTGNLKRFMLKDMMEKNPERVVELAVKGMLPKNKLAGHMLKRLRVYAGESHPHVAQTGVAVAAVAHDDGQGG